MPDAMLISISVQQNLLHYVSTSRATSTSTFTLMFSAQQSASNDKENEIQFMDPR